MPLLLLMVADEMVGMVARESLGVRGGAGRVGGYSGEEEMVDCWLMWKEEDGKNMGGRGGKG